MLYCTASTTLAMTAPLRSLSDSSHHSDSTRKRISKACDRCRLKKSKCNGDSPCSRCSADNAICVFGERKRAHDRVYPKGYVEMLEQQQSQLVSGLQETYRRLQAVNAWPGAALDEREGRPLTHDILSVLDIIHHKTADGQIASMMFEDDPEKLQQRLIAHGAPFLHRRASISSESDHSVTQSSYSQSTHSHKRVKSCVDSPITSPKSSIFRQSFDHQRLSKNKPSDSHTSASNTSVPVRNPHRPSPLHLDLSEINNQQPPPFEEDALMASFSWQDVQPDMISDTSTDMPQFSFPMSNNDYAGMAQWPLFAQPGIAAMGQNGPGFTSLQQLQRDPLDTDFTGFGMPVGVQT